MSLFLFLISNVEPTPLIRTRKYSSDDMRVVIYDSKGLEHGHFQDFIGSTNEFFDSHQVSDSKGVSADAIHVIW